MSDPTQARADEDHDQWGTPSILRMPVNDNLTVLMPGRRSVSGRETLTALDAGSVDAILQGAPIPMTWGFEQRDPYLVRSVSSGIHEQWPPAVETGDE